MAFWAKDTLLVVDEFTPRGSRAEVQRFHQAAERVLRGQGNGSGRQRLRADTSFRSGRPPRGLIVSTGEDLPNGQSLQARLFTVEVNRGDISAEKLTSAQALAESGLYAQAMSGFIRHFVPDYAKIVAGIARKPPPCDQP